MELGKKVLVVDDESSFREALSVGLAREGFEVIVAADGVEALDKFSQVAPDVVLLDVLLPRLSGIEVCRQIRNQSDVPIIMVSAKGSEIDAVVGLEVGADDYISKPYRLRELIARINAVLRRVAAGSVNGSAEASIDEFVVGDLTLDIAAHELYVRGQMVVLPLKEWDLLEMLVLNAGHVVSRERLLEEVWGHDFYGDTKTLDVHVKRLRDRIELESSKPSQIVTVRGVGYKFVR